MPGSKLIRVPWLSSAYSKPSSRISRNRARPSLWRWEFQQVDREYIEENPPAARTAAGGRESHKLHIRVAGAEHRRKAGRFFLAPPYFARLFKMPVITDNFQGAFAVDFLFQSPQCFIYRLAFFQFDFGQI